MRSLRSSTFASSAAVILSLSPGLLHAQTTPSSEEQALRQRVEDLERQLKQLEERFNQQAKPEAPATGQPAQPVEAAKPAEPSPQEQAMQKQIDELGQQVKSLEQKAPSPQAVAAKKNGLTLRPGARPGLLLTSPDSDFQLRFGALVQVDYRGYLDQPAVPPGSATNEFLLRRVRPIFEGGYDNFGFLIVPDFGNNQDTSPTTAPTPQIFDAFIYWSAATEFNVRVGKFKAPLGLELLQEDVNLAFPERAFPSDLVPNRDIGIMFSGAVLKRTVNYAVGVFDGAVDNSNVGTGDFNNGKDFNARIFAQPWKNTNLKALSGLGVGIAYGRGLQSGSVGTPALPTYVTPGQQSFFTYTAGTSANGERITWAPQLYYSVGPFSLLGEYTNTAQEFTRATNTQNVSNNAWQVQLAWVLSGEDASYYGVIPTHSFNPSKGQWGSLELVARVSKLTVDHDAFVGSAATQLANPSTQANKATDYGVGLSWDLSREIRILLDYDQTSFDGGAVNGGDRPDEKVIIVRFQYAI
jgi:phosphate-selective porin OprO/OprP